MNLNTFSKHLPLQQLYYLGFYNMQLALFLVLVINQKRNQRISLKLFVFEIFSKKNAVFSSPNQNMKVFINLFDCLDF